MTLAIQNTRFDKARVFDKIVVSMVKNCVNNLSEQYIDEVLSADNITRFDSPYHKVLTFNLTDIDVDPTFDAEELKLLEVIYKVNLNKFNLEWRTN